MASPEYLDWLSNQPHKPGDKITNWQKLTSRFLPPKGVKTWGEWYAAEGVTPKPRKEETKKTTSKQVSSKVEILKRKVNLLKLQLTAPGIGAAEQNRLIQEFRSAQDDLLNAEKELLETEANEGKLTEEQANKRATDILRFDVRRLRERKQLAERLGQPTDDIDKELAAKEEDLKKSIKPTGVVESSFGAPEVRGGQAVVGTGGSVTGPSVVAEPKITATKPVVTTPSKTDTPPTVRDTTVSETETGGKGDGKRGRKDDFASVFREAQSLYGGIDELFKDNEELKALLTRAVGKVEDPDDNYTVDRFISELSNTEWFKTNAGPIRQRGFFKRQYEELENQIKTDDPNFEERIAELRRTSEYGRGLQSTVEKLRDKAVELGTKIDEGVLQFIAKNLYDYANEDDDIKVRNAILGAGKFDVANVVGGEAGSNLRELMAVARANGRDLLVDYKTSIPTWLDRMAKGESIETIKDLIRKDVQTGYNLDDRTRALLDQGVDLATIYSPFRKQMASLLELPEDQVSLKDLADKGVIGGEKPMTLYEFKRALRKDDRWQYTENARGEMAALTENLLRDFGFVG
jgi:hypothetical protein